VIADGYAEVLDTGYPSGLTDKLDRWLGEYLDLHGRPPEPATHKTRLASEHWRRDLAEALVTFFESQPDTVVISSWPDESENVWTEKAVLVFPEGPIAVVAHTWGAGVPPHLGDEMRPVYTAFPEDLVNLTAKVPAENPIPVVLVLPEDDEPEPAPRRRWPWSRR